MSERPRASRQRPAAVRKTYKLYIGGAFPRSECGRCYPVTDRRRRVRWPTPRGLAQGRPRRGPGRARAASRLGRSDRLQPRPGPLPGRRDARGSARPSSPPRSPPPKDWAPQAAQRRWTPRSTAGSGTRAGRTRSRRSLGAANPVAGPYFNFSLPEPTGVVGVVAPERSEPARPGLGARPGGRRPATPRSSSRRPPGRSGGDAGRSAGDLRPARRRRQHPDRLDRRARAVAGVAPRRQRDRPGRRRRRVGAGGRVGGGRRREPEAGRTAGGRRLRLDGRSGAVADQGVPRD